MSPGTQDYCVVTVGTSKAFHIILRIKSSNPISPFLFFLRTRVTGVPEHRALLPAKFSRRTRRSLARCLSLNRRIHVSAATQI